MNEIDILTNLPNLKSLEHDLSLTENPQVFLLDLKNYTSICAKYGEDKSQLILIMLSKILSKYAEKNKMKVYKAQTDKFILLQDYCFDILKLESDILKLSNFINNIEIKHKKLKTKLMVSFVFGISVEKIDVLEKAERALKIAKSKHKHFASYCELLEDEFDDIVTQWADVFKEAIDQDRLIPYFQCIVHKSKKIEYFEALARILVKGKLKEPKDFLRSAKFYKLMGILTNSITKRIYAIKADFDIAVNIDENSMKNIQFYKDFKNLRLEISVENILNNINLVNDFLNNINYDKNKIILDHCKDKEIFLSKLDFSRIGFVKIGGSLIKNITIDTKSKENVKEILSLAQKYQIKTIATYVNSEEIFQAAKELGIDFFQGYYIQLPSSMPSKELKI